MCQHEVTPSRFGLFQGKRSFTRADWTRGESVLESAETLCDIKPSENIVQLDSIICDALYDESSLRFIKTSEKFGSADILTNMLS